MEFLDLLSFQQNQAKARGDEQLPQAVAVLRTAFLVGHLGRWLGSFILPFTPMRKATSIASR